MQLQQKHKEVFEIKHMTSEIENRNVTKIQSCTAEVQVLRKLLEAEKLEQKKMMDLNNLMTQKEIQHTDEIQNLATELHDMRERFKAEELKQIVKSKTILNLMREKKILAAQIRQLQGSAHQNVNKSSKKLLSTERSSDSDSEYEVEFVHSHKVVKMQRQFFVRWKGYSDRHDSWVRENDLKCPIILNKYLKQHNLK